MALALALVATATLLTISSGCSGNRSTTPTGAPDASLAPEAQPLPRTMALEETRAPHFAVSEFVLPAGCDEVADNTDRLAAYSQNTGRAYPSSVLGLLDLTSGRYRTVLAQPVGSGRAFNAFTPMLSDEWLAWEEVSPTEANAMRDAEWRLYAAPIDRSRLRIGAPVLVDEGITDYKLRPHYGVEGSTVYWSVNTVPSHHQEYVARSGRVVALDLASNMRSTLHEGRPLVALKSSGKNVIVVEGGEGVDGSGGSSSYRAVIIDSRTGEVVVRQELRTPERPAHFADYADGWLAWAPFVASGAQWPDLYLRGPDGSVTLAGLDSIDPAFFGRYLAYESVASTASASGGLRRDLRQIWGFDTTEPKYRFRLLETTDDEGWWQTTRAGHTERTLVLWNDLGPWLEDQTQARTLVRVYRTRY